MIKNNKDEVRNQKIEIRVSESEKKKIQKMSKEVGMTISDLLRESLKNNSVIVLEKEQKEEISNSKSQNIYDERRVLYGIANNLNQLTKFTHQESKMHSEIPQLVNQIKEILLTRF